MLEGYFDRIDEEIWAPYKKQTEKVGGKLRLHNSSFPNLAKIKLAIIGNGYPADAFRKVFYALHWRFDNLEIADLGNLVETRNEKEKQFALSEALCILQEMNIPALIIGGENSNIYAQYKSFRNSGEQLEIVKVSPDIDLEEGSPLRQILVEKPSNLFNIDFLGTQAYYISQKTAVLLDKMYFENHRLGEIRADIAETEPLLRSAHIMMFDMNSIRVSDAPGTTLQSPNGLYSEEAAAIARYAGISNKLGSALFYGLAADRHSETSISLLSQMAWYFVEGFFTRFNDHPVANHKDFIIYRNRLSSTGHEITFYKSNRSNRWWMEIPHPYDKNSFFIGCSYKDYEKVCGDEMPDRWWRAYQRLM